jgi:GPH family glycoside/pentoside/hexuronide:cation symporter
MGTRRRVLLVPGEVRARMATPKALDERARTSALRSAGSPQTRAHGRDSRLVSRRGRRTTIGLAVALCLFAALVAPVAARPTAKVFGLDFGPFVTGSGPAQVSDAQLRGLMRLIRPYTSSLRTYGCGLGLAKVVRLAHSMGMDVALEAWIGRDSAGNDREVACLISEMRTGDVNLAIVGSEALLRDDVAPATLVGYINRVKSATAGSGVPVGTADDYSELLANPSVMAASDIVLPDIYPYFAGVSVGRAVAFVRARYREIQAAAPRKAIRIAETGWPSCGQATGNAVPSAENAATYFVHFQAWARSASVRSYYFEAFDEPWKAQYEGRRGACFGIATARGRLKTGMKAGFTSPPRRAPSMMPAVRHLVLRTF